MFKRIDHIEIVTADVERSIGFYCGLLGFRIKARQRVEQSHLGGVMDLVYLDLGGTMVELIHYAGAGPGKVAAMPPVEHQGYRMMAIEVADMDAALAHLKPHGIEPVWGPLKRPQYARAEVRDPDGNHVELRQWLPGTNIN